MAVISMNVFSVYVKQNMDVTVVLPDDVFTDGGSGDEKLP